MRKLSVSTLVLILLLSLLSFAQDESHKTPNEQNSVSRFIWVEHEQVKPGKDMQYETASHRFVEAANSINSDFHWVAARPLTGHANQATYVGLANSWANLATAVKSMNQIEAKFAGDTKVMSAVAESSGPASSFIAEYVPELSYQPTKVDLAHATAWRVTTVHLKIGALDQLKPLIAERIAAFGHGGVGSHWLVYRVVAGMPSPTILVVNLANSLADFDQDFSAAEKKALPAGADERWMNFVRENTVSVETQIYAVDPSISRPPQNVVAANPGFWNAKSPMAPTVASNKKVKVKKGPQTAQAKP